MIKILKIHIKQANMQPNVQFSMHSFLLMSFLTITLINPISTTDLPHNYHLNCGTATPTTTSDDTTWQTDEDPTLVSLQALKANTSEATPKNAVDTSLQAPYTSARIFHSPFTYTFPVSLGPKFVRLYFNAFATYDNLHGSKYFLTSFVNGGSGSFTLLRNFSAYLLQDQFKNNTTEPIGKEFLVSVTSPWLNLTFSPASDGSLAFINGIEIISVPDDLYDYLEPNSNRPTPCARALDPDAQDLQLEIPGPTALELVARLNIGGTNVQSEKDSGRMSRTWYDDSFNFDPNFPGDIPNWNHTKLDYSASVLLRDTAPDPVYWTARVMGLYNRSTILKNNLTWIFSVDPGFRYIVRLLFCELDPGITGINQRVFNIFINGQMAQKQFDVMSLSGGRNATPVCTDYVTGIIDGGEGVLGASNLWLALHPDTEYQAQDTDAILNGLEIFKLNTSDGNLASPHNPAPLPEDEIPGPNNGKAPPLGDRHLTRTVLAIAGVVGSIVSIILIALAFWWCRMSGKAEWSTTGSSKLKWLLSPNHKSGSTTSQEGSSLPSDLCRHFTLNQIKAATFNFAEEYVIGIGGFGKVYKASILKDGKSMDVAIKRLNPESKQGAHEFRTEIEMLSTLRHVHLVSLIGYCCKDSEMVLVYDYMPLGTLRDHLQYKNKNTNPMPWKKRLRICIGAASGLHYLHSGANRVIIHRDVKSTNILLDQNWVAKISDFGLCKVGPMREEDGSANNHVSTMVKGSIGYLDPEYRRSQQLTEKSDVYSFGVVLLEVLCARPVIDTNLPKDQVNLALYAKKCYKNNNLKKIVDSNVRHKIAPECLKKFVEIAETCVREKGCERPSMAEVLCGLEFALKLQETAELNNIDGENGEVREENTSSDDVSSVSDGMFSTTLGNLSAR